MTVEVKFLQSNYTETIPNSALGVVDPVEVTVVIQDLPADTDMFAPNFLVPDPSTGSYTITGYLMPYKDSFNIEPAQTISMQKGFEYIRVHHADMQRFLPNGLPVRARRHIALNNFQPTPEEDAIIQPK